MELQGQDVVIAVALSVALVKIFRGPIGAALAERIRGHAGAAEDPTVAAEVDQLRARLAELEERLDFAERMLAQAREAVQLPGGVHR